MICLLAGLLTVYLLAPQPLMAKLYAVAYGLSPQRPAHSIFIGGRQPPLEARLFGVYGGFAVALVYLLATSERSAARFPPPPVLLTLLAGVLALAIDGTNALFHDLGLFHLYRPDNRLRLATGLASGAALAGLFLPSINTFFQQKQPARRIMSSGFRLAGFVAAQAILYSLTVLDVPWLLYPLSLLAVGGILALLTSVNLLMVASASGPAPKFGTSALIALSLMVVELALLHGLRLVVQKATGIVFT